MTVFIIFAFSSCSDKATENGTDTQITSGEIPSFEITFSNETDESGFPVNDGDEPYRSYQFDSYKGLYNALIGANDEISKTIFSPSVDIYEATLLSFEEERSKVYVPMSNGSPIALKNNKEFPIITFYSSGFIYNLPYIWSHHNVYGYDIDIRVAYPSVLNNEKVNNVKSYVELLGILAPTAPTPSTNSNMYEKELTLADGEKVTALINPYRYPECLKVYISYYQNGVVFSFSGDARILNDEFFKSLYMVEYLE